MRIAGVLAIGLAVAVSDGRAAPTALVATGDVSPLGLPFSRFSDVAIDGRGRVAFIGASTGVFRRTEGGVERVLAAGDSVGAQRVAGVGPPARTGDCLAVAVAMVGGGASVLRRCAASEFDPVAALGSTSSSGATFSSFGAEVVVGGDGSVAFTALVEDGATALFVADRSNVIVEVIRTGMPAPAGGTLVGIVPVGVSGTRKVGFRGAVSGGNEGLFVWDGVRVRKVAVVHDASPVGGRFADFGGAALNADDQWAFRAVVSDRSAESPGPVAGVFRAHVATVVPDIRAVILEGDPTPLGGAIRELPTSLVPSINDRGDVVLRATLIGASSSAAVLLAPADGPLTKVMAVGDETAAGELRRLREAMVARDGSVLARASVAGGPEGLFLVRDGRVESLAMLGEATDLGEGFRFQDPSVTDTAEEGMFLGFQEGVYLASGPSFVDAVAVLGQRTPVGGTYTGFDPPAAGGGRVVFGASVRDGRSGRVVFGVGGGRRPRTMVRAGIRVPGAGRILDLFPDDVDFLARAGVRGGTVAVHASLGRAGSPFGVFVRRGGALRLVAKAGKETPIGGRYVAFGTPAVLQGGRVAFVAKVSGGNGGAALVVGQGARARSVAATDGDTRTRLGSQFRTLGPLAAGGRWLGFRGTLASVGVEGLFLARGQRVFAAVGSGDPGPTGGRFRTFGPPTFGGRYLMFRASTSGAPSPGGLYRMALPGRLSALGSALPVEEVTLVNDPSPLLGKFVAFGTPSGNSRGQLAYTAELLGASSTSAVFVERTTDRAFP